MTNEQINDGGPAYPSGKSEKRGFENSHPLHEGMSLRDWFAGQALASMTTAPDYSKGPCNAAMAERAYVIADAMLAARKEGGK